MVAPELDPFDQAMDSALSSAVHLEMRDTYAPTDLSFVAWKGGPPFDRTDRERQWQEFVGGAVDRGVVVRRARIVSEPVTDYIAFEHSVTPSMNLAAGEQVRWLPRMRASDLALPGNDFWLFDDRLVRFSYFAGDGEYIGEEWVADPAVAKLCASAFEAVWERAIDHHEYRI